MHRFLTRFGPMLPVLFDADWYLQANPDVALSGVNPSRHYARHGSAEGRSPCFMPSKSRERDLRWGYLDAADLRCLLKYKSSETLTTLFALARHAARNDDWVKAAHYLDPLDPARDIVLAFAHPDYALFAMEASVMVGNQTRAQLIWQHARMAFGTTPDLMLARANLSKPASFGWGNAVNGMYRKARLPGPTFRSPTHDIAAFDRLSAPDLKPIRNGPLVSVIVPAKNAERTIGTALRSLREQSWQQLEIIVVDNGSTDGTARMVATAIMLDPRVRLLDGSALSGTYAARNHGVATATGTFVTVLDADDWAHPFRIARQVKQLRKSTSAAACLTDWVRVTNALKFSRWWQDKGLIHPDVSSLMIRKQALTRLGYWDQVKAGADSEYIDRLRASYGAAAICTAVPGIPLGFGRICPESLTQASGTHIDTHINGPRRTYRKAAARWHKRMNDSLPLQPNPAQRPFPAPADLIPSSSQPYAEHPLIQAGIYDDDWYMRTYPDLRENDVDGLTHFLEQGEAQGRSPGPGFSPSAYRLAHGVLNHSPTHDFLKTRRSPLPSFSGALPAPVPDRHILFFGHRAGEHLFGAERCLPHLLDQALAEGMIPSVVLPQICNAEYLSDLRKRSHKVHVVPYGQLFGRVMPHPTTVKSLTALIKDCQVSAIHQNTAVLDAPLIAARHAGIETIVHVHERPDADVRLCCELGLHAPEIRDYLLPLADRFVAVSPDVAEWIDQPDRVELNVPGIAADLATLPFDPPNTPRIALIGSLTARKGLSDMLALARRFLRKSIPAEFLLIGPASTDLSSVRLPPNCRHTGYAETPRAAMAQTDVVLCLSHFAESYGLTMAEALCAGRPVISYDRGTPPTLVGTGGAGIIVPPDQPELLDAALLSLLASRPALLSASAAARSRGQILMTNQVSRGIFNRDLTRSSPTKGYG
ncbi:MAG: glycosyltransferase [Paracoccaceae bacterium]